MQHVADPTAGEWNAQRSASIRGHNAAASGARRGIVDQHTPIPEILKRPIETAADVGNGSYLPCGFSVQFIEKHS